MPDQPATIYIKRAGRLYRIRVYQNTVMIKRQTNEVATADAGMLTDPADEYDGVAWDYEALGQLTERYEAHIVTLMAKIGHYSDRGAE